ALARAAAGAAPRARLLAAAARRARGVGDLGGALFGHALLLQAFVLLFVLDVGTLRGHASTSCSFLSSRVLCPLLHVNMPSVGSRPCRIDAPSSLGWRRPTIRTCLT